MPDIQHKDIPDAQLHEVKGALASTAGEVLTSTGGASSWADPVDQIAAMTVTRVIDSESTAASQLPSALDAPLQVEFGAESLNAEASLSTAGALTINESGTYRIKVSLSLGRSSGTGTAHIFLRALVGGVQAGRSVGYQFSAANVTHSFTDEAWLTLPAGEVITYEIVRDSAGNNDGGLYQATLTTLGWNDAPSAAIRVEKFA